MALKPLHDAATIKRVVVSTYQSVSGAGKEAMDELFAQTRAIFVSDTVETEQFPKQIAFNVIPQIDVFMDDGYTKEEWKMMVETKKILDPKIKLTATCVRVPVFIGHAEAVNVEFEKPITRRRGARTSCARRRACSSSTSTRPAATSPRIEAAGEDATYVSRIREDPTVENGLSLLVRRRQSAQRRGAQRGADRRAADQPQAHHAEAEGGVRWTPSPPNGSRHRSASKNSTLISARSGLHDDWERLKREMRPGDRIVRFESPATAGNTSPAAPASRWCATERRSARS